VLTSINFIEPKAEASASFGSEFARVARLLSGSDGCAGALLQRSLEHADKLMIMVEWESIAHHRTFSASPPGERLKEFLLSTCQTITPSEHFETIVG
jgi:heme-degrading monooxygenase HmoA